MKPRTLIIIGFLIVFAVLIAALWPYNPARESVRPQPNLYSNSPIPPSQAPATSAPSRNPNQTATPQMIANSIVETLLKHGALVRLPGAQKTIEDAIATKDKGAISRAFDDVIYRRRMSDALPALKGFLNDPDPFVRYLAAHDLLIAGDSAGYQTLLALVQAPAPISGIGEDVRVEAAQALAQYNQTGAVQAIFQLYQKTQNGYLIAALDKLAPDQVGTLIPPTSYYSDASAIRDYGIEGDRQYIPQLTATFYKTQDAGQKVAAAWALATMTGDANAINFLIQTAQPLISAKATANGMPVTDGSYNEMVSQKALTFLGTIQTAQAKQTLESALDSPVSIVAQTATVNLIYNQGGSSKANALVASQLTGETNVLGADLALSIAAQSSDSQIQNAGQKSAATDPMLWNLYTVERKDWSIYNWIGNYVVKLNSH